MEAHAHIVTRVAPSPTGLFHIGTARTSLFNFLYARKYGGTFLVRIEDTDKTRSEKKYEDDILAGLSWLKLEHDGLVRQSERTELYTEKLQELITADKAYVSEEPAKDDPTKHVAVVRLRNPGREVSFEDAVRGVIVFDTTELGDFVIARSTTDPLYHFAVVVDDALSGVTDVIRGEDHISNTPRQILILEALGFPRPRYAHIPLILAQDRSKLSKRKGAVSLSDYKAQGFLPEAMVNYLALLGWNPGTEQEIFNTDELILQFSLEQIQKSPAVFDMEKLTWVQREHRKALTKEALVAMYTKAIASHPPVLQALQRSSYAMNDVIERHACTGELMKAIERGEYDFYLQSPTVSKDMLVWKKDAMPEKIPERLQKLSILIETVDASTFSYDAVKSAVWAYAEEEGRGMVLWPLRVALSGKERSPDPFILAEALGKGETLARIKRAQKEATSI